MLLDGLWKKGTLLVFDPKVTIYSQIILWPTENLHNKSEARIMQRREGYLMWLGCKRNVVGPEFYNYPYMHMALVLYEKSTWEVYIEPQLEPSQVFCKILG